MKTKKIMIKTYKNTQNNRKRDTENSKRKEEKKNNHIKTV